MKYFTTVIIALSIAFATVSCASTGEEVSGTPETTQPPKNLALGQPIVSNGHIMDFVAENAVDGEILSYFEGPANQYPNELTIDLERSVTLTETKVRLNPRRLWQDRKQTIEVLASSDGSEFAAAVPAAEYAFSPEDNQNTISIPLSVTARHLRLVFTANTEATGGQVAEWEIYGK